MSADNYIIEDQDAIYFLTFTSKAIVKLIQEIPEGRRDWLLYRFEFAGKFKSKRYYIHQNPVKAMIVTHPHEYLFSSAVDYFGDRGFVEVEVVI